MKKITFTLILFCAATGYMSAQTTFAFFRNGVQVENNAVITVSKTSLDELDALVLESGLSLKNLTNSVVTARAQQVVENIPPSETYGILNFCFNLCQTGNINRSQKREIEADYLFSPPEFHLCYFPLGTNYFQVKVRYIVQPDPMTYPSADPNDVINVTIIYDFNEHSGETTANTVAANNNILTAYQADNALKIKYQLDGEKSVLRVYNLLGTEVTKTALQNRQGIFTIPNLQKGIYFCAIEQNGKSIITKKIILK